MALPVEIERKFLVRDAGWQAAATDSGRIRQGYLNQAGGTTVRVRRCEVAATLAIKSFRDALARIELEYEIPTDHADYLLQSVCDRIPVEKIRHRVVGDGGSMWVVDVYLGANEGLITAEIELERASDSFILPDWIGPEVTNDPRYSNSRLFRYPFSEWRMRVAAMPPSPIPPAVRRVPPAQSAPAAP